MAVVGTSVGGGAGEGIDACLGAVPDGAGLALEVPPPAGFPRAVPGRARLLDGCAVGWSVEFFFDWTEQGN